MPTRFHSAIWFLPCVLKVILDSIGWRHVKVVQDEAETDFIGSILVHCCSLSLCHLGSSSGLLTSSIPTSRNPELATWKKQSSPIQFFSF